MKSKLLKIFNYIILLPLILDLISDNVTPNDGCNTILGPNLNSNPL